MPGIHAARNAANAIYAPSKTSTRNQPLPPDVAKVMVHEWDSRDWCQSSDAFADWLNARWAKTGYTVSRETVCFTLRAAGRNAKMGLGDPKDGKFWR